MTMERNGPDPDPTTASVDSVIAALHARRPGMTPHKTHLLLFFAQGHHLAWHGRPLFSEPLYATERGVAVEDTPGGNAPALQGEGPLNTAGYVVERYADLSPADLRTLIQVSQPWRAATGQGVVPHIEWVQLRDWFLRPDETDDPDDERPNRAQMADAMEFWRSLNTIMIDLGAGKTSPMTPPPALGAAFLAVVAEGVSWGDARQEDSA